MDSWKRRIRHSAVLPCLVVLLLFPIQATAIWPFPPKRFKGNAFTIADSLGIGEEGRVAAFGDFDGDQFLDVVTLSEDQRQITLYVWNHEEFRYKQNVSFSHPERVTNIVPGDFTRDGKLDLLVMSMNHPGAQTTNLAVYRALTSQVGFESTPLSVPPSAVVQPIPLDADGDMKIDLFGHVTADPSSFRLWQNVWGDPSDPTRLFEVVEPVFTGMKCNIANPHSNAFVDFNGDCLADLFLVCHDPSQDQMSFQIWLNGKDNGFTIGTVGGLPRGVGQITFADMDRDGTMDMVFPTCTSVSKRTGYGTGCAINIAYNKQKPLCSTSTPGAAKNPTCRAPEDLCSVDPAFSFDLRNEPDNDAFVRIPLDDIFPSEHPSLLMLDTTADPAIPLQLKVGDANLDGFPDLLPITVSSQHDTTPRMLWSVPCAAGIVGCGANGKGRRGFKLIDHKDDGLAAIKDARGVAFLDMDEDGTLDIMVQRTGKQGKGKVTFVQNNFYHDAFFLKAIVLNGACNGLCTPANASEPKYHPFGVSCSGATFKYTILDTSGKRAAAQVAQLPQTSYHSLQTPYSFFGLGRTNNYIENLFVGSTKHDPEHYINMEGVIPNSRVVIIPPSKERPGDWKRQLYLRPGEWIPWVTLTVVAATVILAGLVFIFHLNEKREDELERRRASHHINFDAL